MAERLQKYLARCGLASRRKAENLIQTGRVQVNQKTVTVLGTTVEPGRDEVRVDGKIVVPEDKPVYLLLNKPKGYVTTVKDERGRPTVLELVNNIPERIYPVGRLDLDTEGLLLLTNDGLLAHRLTHPKHEIPKTYHALIQGYPSRATLNRLRQGIILDGKKTAPAQVRVIKNLSLDTLVEVVIHEGRNRQVRRMFAQVGHPVIGLKRVRLAFLTLGKLKVGEYRHLTKKEVERLYNLIS
ncbi:MAG: rRNA pseudouridine synthase [Clostridia bacterium]|nr:rRNA pseudouridine synthase [Clostridia bacterium]